jgi:hypothetical protein
MDNAQSLLDDLGSEYMQGLRAPTDWIAATFGYMTDNELNDLISQRFTKWTTEFQPL